LNPNINNMKNRKNNLAITLFVILGLVCALSSCTEEDNGTKPVIETGTVSNINIVTAASGGSISSEGSSEVTQRGVCWNKTANPTIKDSLTKDAAGTGEFSSILTGLKPNTTYYVRAYATNKSGTAYGLQVIYKTPEGKIQVITNSVTNIFANSCISRGSIVQNYGELPCKFGVCWSKVVDPTIDLVTKTVDSLSLNINSTSFESSILNLEPSTTYFIRAYASNAAGVFYGENVRVTTLAATQTVTDIDGNIYHTIKIGGQIWMVENLKTTKYNDGTNIPNVTDNNQWVSSTSGAYCNYNNDVSNATTYGRLYNWYAVNNNRKIAPSGWHVPTDDEWYEMIMYLGGVYDACGKIKEAGTSHWITPNTVGINVSGFTALPAGHRVSFGEFTRFGDIAIWWTNTEDYSDARYSWRTTVSYDENYIIHNRNEKNFGFSVRCVKD